MLFLCLRTSDYGTPFIYPKPGVLLDSSFPRVSALPQPMRPEVMSVHFSLLPLLLLVQATPTPTQTLTEAS